MNIPWRLILTLIFLTLVAIFAGLNLNPTTVSIGFYQFENVPLFLVLIFTFILGCFTVLPFTVFLKKGKKPESKAKPSEKQPHIAAQKSPEDQSVPKDPKVKTKRKNQSNKEK